jgi:signal transduction histidine kinase
MTTVFVHGKVDVMPGVKNLPVSSETCYESVKEILCLTVEAVQAKYGAVSFINDENDSLQDYVSHGSPISRGDDISVAQWVASHGQSIALETEEEALQVSDLTIAGGEKLPLICTPIRVDGETLGVLQLNLPLVDGRRELQQKRYTIELAAELLGYVIENANLRHQLQEEEQLLREVNQSSIEIQEAERERITLEVHDGVAQTLASAFQYLQTVDKIDRSHFDQYQELNQLFTRAVGLVRQAIQETRGVINNVTPATLDVHGLVPTVRQELKQLQRETGCHIDFRLSCWPNLPTQVEFAVYRIIHEAVNNVRKHAQSSRLKVEMSQEQKRLVIRVKDWGIGFATDKLEPSSPHRSTGLLSMRRRAELLGGTFKINSSVGKGTEILVDIPCIAEQE